MRPKTSRSQKKPEEPTRMEPSPTDRPQDPNAAFPPGPRPVTPDQIALDKVSDDYAGALRETAGAVFMYGTMVDLFQRASKKAETGSEY